MPASAATAAIVVAAAVIAAAAVVAATAVICVCTCAAAVTAAAEQNDDQNNLGTPPILKETIYHSDPQAHNEDPGTYAQKCTRILAKQNNHQGKRKSKNSP